MESVMDSAAENEAKPTKDDSTSPSTRDSDLVRKIKKNLTASSNHLKKWNDAAKESYKFFAGEQWDTADIAKLNEEGRPAIVFNRIPRVINAVAGLELQNRQEVVYLPRENGDVVTSDILTGAANWVRDSCDAEDEESQAFKDCLMTGMGWIETRLDYEVDLDGAIIIERVDPTEMNYDPRAVKRNIDDAAWVSRTKYYSRQEFKEIWPDADEEISMDFEADPKGMTPHDATLAPWYINDQSDDENREHANQIEVIQYQYWKREVFYRIEVVEFDEQGQEQITIEEMEASKFRKRREWIEEQGYNYIKQTKKVYKQVFLAGDYILEEGDCPVNAFTFRAITGLVNHCENSWFGLIQVMKDPQMWANKWLSQTLHIVNTNAKGGYFYEPGTFKNPREAEQNLATASLTALNEDGLQKLQKKEPTQMPPGIDQLLEYAVTSISDLVGVNLEMLGMANRDQAGVVEAERKRAGITVVSDFFDALRRYRKEQGRVLADFIITYISDGRLIKITGDGLGKYVPLLKESLDFKYDIIVDDSPTSPNQREAIFGKLTTLFPVLLEAGIPIPEEILDYAPLPSQLIVAWKKVLEEAKQPNPAEQEKEELRKQLAELEVQLKAVEASKKEAEVAETQSKTALNAAKMEHEVALASLEGEKNARENLDASLKVFKEL